MQCELGLRDRSIKPKAPAWGSVCYPETGVLLRNSIGADRETMLYLIAGRNHSHYFNDSGSITLWGKRRELCDEDDYQNRRGDEARTVFAIPLASLQRACFSLAGAVESANSLTPVGRDARPSMTFKEFLS